MWQKQSNRSLRCCAVAYALDYNLSQACGLFVFVQIQLDSGPNTKGTLAQRQTADIMARVAIRSQMAVPTASADSVGLPHLVKRDWRTPCIHGRNMVCHCMRNAASGSSTIGPDYWMKRAGMHAGQILGTSAHLPARMRRLHQKASSELAR